MERLRSLWQGAATVHLVFWLVCTSKGNALDDSISVLSMITAHSILQIHQLRGLFPVVVSRFLVMYWVYTACHACDGVTSCCCSSWAGREISLSTLCCAVKESTFRIRSFSFEYSRTLGCMLSHGAIVSSTVTGMISSTQLALVSSDVILAFLKAASALRN